MEFTLNDELIDAQHYSINPTSATIYFHKSLPNYNTYEYTDLVVVLSENRDEISGNFIKQKYRFSAC